MNSPEARRSPQPTLEALEPRLLLSATTLIATGDTAALLVPTSDTLGTTWRAQEFDDSSWQTGPTGIGYERSSGYESYIATDTEAQMYGQNSTAYIRMPFTIPTPSAVEGLTLRMRYDDGFVAFINGTEVASANAPATLTWNSDATNWHNDADAVIFQDYDVSSYIGSLTAGENVLAIHGLNGTSSTSSDFLISPELVADINETTFNVVSTTPADGAYVAPAPAQMTVDFAEGIDTGTVDASDLTIGGQAATGYTVLDADTVEFDLPSLSAGIYNFSLADGAITSSTGKTLNPFVGELTVVSAPGVTVEPATGVLPGSATLNGQVTDTGYEAPQVTVVWGETDEGTTLGNWYAQVDLGETGFGDFFTDIDGLVPETTYYYRAVATNTAGATWTSVQSFTTGTATMAGVQATDATDLLPSAATLNGEVLDTGGIDPEVHIVWGDEDAGQVAGNWDHDVDLGTLGAGTFSTLATGLTGGQTYYFSVYAVNAAGTSWAPASASFTTPDSGPIVTELMASNQTTLADEDGDYSDWLEIHNPTGAPVDLTGWYLTDDDGDMDKWAFPAVTVPAEGYLVVFASSKDRAVAGSELHTNFNLSAAGEYLALVQPTGTVANQFDFPSQFGDISYGLTADLSEVRFFSDPTPGTENGSGIEDLGPAITEVGHAPSAPTDTQDIVVTARVTGVYFPVDTVRMYYRVNYGSETQVTMYDDGAHGDGGAGDGIYGAVIPHTVSDPGDMVRYYITATDTESSDSRWPIYLSPTSSAEYLGTVIEDPAIDSDLPVIHWFVQNPSAANTRTGTRASVYYLGEFYDNVFVRVRGGSTAGQPNPSHKFDFNPGHKFLWDPDEGRVDEFNLNSNVSDKSWMRQWLSWELFRETGSLVNETFLMRVEQNGTFYGVNIWIEQTEEEMLERLGLGLDAALFKVVGNGNGLQGTYVLSQTGIEQKMGVPSDWDLLYELATEGNPWGGTGQNWMYDNTTIPSLINYVAVKGLINDTDHGHKNFYPYLDKATGEWQLLPWDHDLTWGRTQSGGVFNDNLYPLGDPTYPWNTVITQLYNRGHTELNGMFMRRLRTLLDDYFYDTTWLDAKIDWFVTNAGPDVQRDYDRWGTWDDDPNWSLSNEISRIRDDFVVQRRAYLNTWTNPKSSMPMPASQGATPNITIDHTVEYNPASGDQDQEYIRLNNPNSDWVDVSHWTLSGAVEYTLPAGTVIPPNDSVYVTPDVAAFRARTVSPTGGQGHFVIGGYSGHLSNWGETIVLANEDGTLIDSHTYTGNPSDAQQYLRITEIMYNPADGPGYDNDDFEFIELQNIGPTSLSLAGVKFVGGISFEFTGGTIGAGERIVLVKNADAFQSRYGTEVTIAGTYGGRLANGGEELNLEDAQNSTIQQFSYSDDWLSQTDGEGFSLTIIDPDGDLDAWGSKEAWRSSNYTGGTPGAGETALWLPGSVVINEIMTHTDEPDDDWIELHNPTGGDIDIGGWYLSDKIDDPMRYRIPAGTVIPAGGFVVFTRSEHFGVEGGPGVNTAFGLSQAGEAVYLSASQTPGVLLGYREQESFAAQHNGVTFGRYVKPDGTVDFVSLAAPTPGEPNTDAKVGPVVISEIMYHPATGDIEYVELRNLTGQTITLFDPAEPTHTWMFTDGIDFTFPSGATIPPYDVALVVPVDPATFRAQYGVDAGVPIYGPYAGALSNGGEKVELSMPGGVVAGSNPPAFGYILVDMVEYDDDAPWPTDADGDGAVLQRIEQQGYGNHAGNWQAAVGTPGVVDGTDTKNPTVVTARFIDNGPGGREIAVIFSEDVQNSLAAGDLTVVVTAGGDPVSIPGLSVSYDVYTYTARWDISGANLQAGVQYTAEISGPGVTDVVGNFLDGDGNGVGGDDYAFHFTPAESVEGDFTGDGLVTDTDVDLLLAAVNAGTNPPEFDLTGDGFVDAADTDELIRVILSTEYGDAGLDQAVDAADLSVLAANWQQPTTGWANADFNGDGTVDAADLSLLAGNWQWTPPAGDAPEAPLAEEYARTDPDGTGEADLLRRVSESAGQASLRVGVPGQPRTLRRTGFEGTPAATQAGRVPLSTVEARKGDNVDRTNRGGLPDADVESALAGVATLALADLSPLG